MRGEMAKFIKTSAVFTCLLLLLVGCKARSVAKNKLTTTGASKFIVGKTYVIRDPNFGKKKQENYVKFVNSHTYIMLNNNAIFNQAEYDLDKESPTYIYGQGQYESKNGKYCLKGWDKWVILTFEKVWDVKKSIVSQIEFSTYTGQYPEKPQPVTFVKRNGQFVLSGNGNPIQEVKLEMPNDIQQVKSLFTVK
jgi:hypothetical protein